MLIVYLHGYNSKFDATNEKVVTLSTLGTVTGPNLDYALGKDYVLDTVKSFFKTLPTLPDLVVGTSLGGWLAAEVGSRYSLPFVAMNPSLVPSVSLLNYKQDIKAETYTDFVLDKEHPGLVLLDSGDELFDSKVTEAAVKDFYETFTFEGGNHRFAHTRDALYKIELFLETARHTYGS